jgi:hypothetical protein
MKIIIQGVSIAASFGVVFVWQNSPLKDFTVGLLGLFIALYLITSARKKGKGFLTMGGGGFLGIFLLNSLIFLLIFTTGGINSALFFILYFLAFGIAFVFEPVTVFVFIIGTLIIFAPEALKADVTANLLKMGSVALVSPLAYFFGKEYQKSDQEESQSIALKERSKEAADTISSDIEEILVSEKDVLKEKDMEKLNEILEETEDLRSEIKQ